MSSTDWMTRENIKELQEVINLLEENMTTLKWLAEQNRFNSDDPKWIETQAQHQELLAHWEEIQNRAKPIEE